MNESVKSERQLSKEEELIKEFRNSSKTIVNLENNFEFLDDVLSSLEAASIRDVENSADIINEHLINIKKKIDFYRQIRMNTNNGQMQDTISNFIKLSSEFLAYIEEFANPKVLKPEMLR